MTEQLAPGPLDPCALSLPDAAALLSRCGETPITVAMLQADLARGAPTNPDGALNLVHYTAWLLHETPRPGGPP